MARRAVSAVVAIALVLGLGACRNGESEGTATQAVVRDVAGNVEVRRTGTNSWVSTDNTTLEAGDRLRVRDTTDEKGRAVVRLARGATLELRNGSAIGFGEIVVLRGDGLAIADESTLSLGTIGAVFEIPPGGVAKLRADLAVVAGSYRETVTVSSGGRSMTVSPLRQVDLAAPGLFPEAPSPLVVDGADEWDRRFLGSALDLGRDLDQRSAGFTAQSRGAAAADADVFRRIVPGLAGEPAFTDALLRSGLPPAGERLVGATLALNGSGGSFTERWRSAMSFRGDGADWGLVALDVGAAGSSVLDDLEVAFSRFAERLEIAARPLVVTPSLVPSAPTSSPAAPPATGAAPSPPTPPPVAPPESPIHLPQVNTGIGLLDEVINPLVTTVNGVLDGLLGGILGTPPPPPPTIAIRRGR